MSTEDIKKFIEEMGKIGDVWTKEEVRDVYGETTLEEALMDRGRSIDRVVALIYKVKQNEQSM